MAKSLSVLLALVMAGALVAGCGAGPLRHVDVGSDEAYLRFLGGKDGQRVYVDGAFRGSASEFNGAPGVLAIAPGLRTVDVREGDKLLLSERVHVGTGVTKTFQLP